MTNYSNQDSRDCLSLPLCCLPNHIENPQAPQLLNHSDQISEECQILEDRLIPRYLEAIDDVETLQKPTVTHINQVIPMISTYHVLDQGTVPGYRDLEKQAPQIQVQSQKGIEKF